MKQRIRIVGIVRRGDDILVLKRNLGRANATTSAAWELPTGKINFGEQPEEAANRLISENFGVNATDVKLKDVITFVALAGSSRLYNLYIVYDITAPSEIDLSKSERYSQYKYISSGSETVELDDSSMSVLEIEVPRAGNSLEKSKLKDAITGATVYVDGGSRGNPGPSGIGYYIVDADGQEIKRGGEFIGFATSRVAEYYALKEGCEQAIELGLKSVRFIMDNLMVINQMNGIYMIKNKDLVPIYNDIQKLIKQFDRVVFVQANREFNKVADREVNLAINRHFGIPDETTESNPGLYTHIE